MNYPAVVAQAVAEKKVSADAGRNITAWLTQEKYATYRAELAQLIDSGAWQQLEDCFFKVVPFGTGGRRGAVGLGSNRINNVTIGESAQGLASYLLTFGPDVKQQGVVIAYDTRTTSVDFAQFTATVFAANGFKVYLFDGFRATPELSFAVRHLHTIAGVVISASHNPPADNGFKAYWSDGGQVVSPHDAAIMDHVTKVERIAATDFAAALDAGVISMIDADVDDAYIKAVLSESLTPSRSVSMAYSPLHGAGSRSVIPTLHAAGFTQLTVVAEQLEPDGRFPNIKNNIPNPEVKDASDLVTQYAQRQQADIAITTDPDADRLGVVARDKAGNYQFLNGNQIAALLCYHVLSNLNAQHKLTEKHFVVKTIVTTDFMSALARDFGVKIYDNILIGFKYVAELIHLLEGKEEFLFGGEESHGILKGSYTRDKDAAVAALLMAELASNVKDQHKTLPDLLNDLYRRYGLYWETLQNIAYPGAQGGATMTKLMTHLRQNPPRELNSLPVVSMIDRLAPDAEGAKGDVLIYYLSADKQTRLTVRPSGTEPKLKIYAQLHFPLAPTTPDEQLAQAKQGAEAAAQQLHQAITAYFEQILQQ